jgi:hypothetical protein
MSTHINHRSGGGEIVHDWGEFTRDRLCWLYGEELGHAKADGVEPRTRADLAAWRRLGRSQGEAA